MGNHNGGETLKGCVDTPGADCSRAGDSCGGAQQSKCCACGGGIEVRCYQKRGCPNVTTTITDVLPGLGGVVGDNAPSGDQLLLLLKPILYLLLALAVCMCLCCCCV